MTTEILKTETNTPEMLRRIEAAWEIYDADYRGYNNADGRVPDTHVGARVVYEHGQHWVTCPCGASWSVGDAMDAVDAVGAGTIDGFGFEVIDDGDEDYHTPP